MSGEKIIRINPTAQPLASEPRPLLPELVNEDFDEVVGIVTRYANRRSRFALAELEEHMALNDVILPELSHDRKDLFTEIQTAVVQQHTENGEERIWVTERIGRVILFSLAKVVYENNTSESVAKPQVTALPHRTTPTTPVKTKEVDVDICGPFEESNSQLLRPKEIKAWLKVINPEKANALFDQAIASGSLTPVTQRGMIYYCLSENVSASEAIASTHQSSVDETKVDARPLSTYELHVAITIMDTLTAPGTHVNQGQTIKSLQQTFGTNITNRDFRKLLRVLETQRLVTINSTANYGKVRKSPKVMVRGQDIKQRWRANKDGYTKRLSETIIE